MDSLSSFQTREIWSLPDFERHFSISHAQLYREARAGRLRLHKRGRRSYILRQDAINWLNHFVQVNGGDTQ